MIADGGDGGGSGWWYWVVHPSARGGMHERACSLFSSALGIGKHRVNELARGPGRETEW